MTALKTKIEQAEARLKALKEQEKAQKARERHKQQAQARKEDTRRKILLGSFYLSKMNENQELKEKVIKQLDTYLTADRDRLLFNLPIAQTAQTNQSGLGTPHPASEFLPK